MIVQKAKNDNYWRGLFIGLIPTFIFSILFVPFKKIWAIEFSNQDFIALVVGGTMVLGVVLYNIAHFIYLDKHFKVKDQKNSLKGVNAGYCISIITVTLVVIFT